MGYATVDDLISRFGERELIQLTDRSTPPADQVDTTVAQPALDAAVAIVDGYVGAKYALPLTSTPALLVDITCDLARYRLFAAQAPDLVTKRYESAMTMLRGISSGSVKIDVDSIEPESRAPVIITSGNERRFTRSSLRDG